MRHASHVVPIDRNDRIGFFQRLAFFLLILTCSQAQAALNLSVTANPDPARPGEAVSVFLTVSNPGGGFERFRPTGAGLS